ncbi:hypothetical protein I6G37_01540 [Serratia rubidaea]|nr:hypothetical protein I6G37_01540 [Serratia rubidaea]
MFQSLINNFFGWLNSLEWGSVSDILGAIANMTMALAAVWGAKTASGWLDNKKNDSAERVFNEIHELDEKYTRVYNKTRNGYEAVQRMYGLHENPTPKVFNVYKELELARECHTYCSSEMNAFKNKLRHSVAIKTKYKHGGGPLKFAELLGYHNHYQDILLNTNIIITKIIKEQKKINTGTKDARRFVESVNFYI